MIHSIHPVLPGSAVAACAGSPGETGLLPALCPALSVPGGTDLLCSTAARSHSHHTEELLRIHAKSYFGFCGPKATDASV